MRNKCINCDFKKNDWCYNHFSIMKKIMNKDRYFMIEAIKEAKISQNEGDWPVGCVIVLDGKIIAKGRNKVYSTNNKILHAEIDAIFKASSILAHSGQKATMYITYEPCPMCFGAIILNHIGRIVCGSNIDKSGALEMIKHLPVRFSDQRYKFQLVRNFMEEECRGVFVSGEPAKKLGLKL